MTKIEQQAILTSLIIPLWMFLSLLLLNNLLVHLNIEWHSWRFGLIYGSAGAVSGNLVQHGIRLKTNPRVFFLVLFATLFLISFLDSTGWLL